MTRLAVRLADTPDCAFPCSEPRQTGPCLAVSPPVRCPSVVLSLDAVSLVCGGSSSTVGRNSFNSSLASHGAVAIASQQQQPPSRARSRGFLVCLCACLSGARGLLLLHKQRACLLPSQSRCCCCCCVALTGAQLKILKIVPVYYPIIILKFTWFIPIIIFI